MNKLKFIILITCCSSLFSCIDEPKEYANTYQGNFDALWNIMDTRYCYFDYKKIDWDSVYTVYQPKVTKTSNDEDFFELMGNMLNELKDGHVNLYSNFDISRYWKWYTDYPSNFSSSLIKKDRYLGDNYRIAGGMKYQIIDNGKIGYIYYGDFSNTFTNDNVKFIFEYFKNCKALIIDVRDNGGGYLSYADMLAGYFFTKNTITNYICHKTGDGHSDFSQPKAITTNASGIQWQRPVAVLTNRMSFSATNAFVSKMKIAPKAIIIGDKTGGGGGMPLSSEIPIGWMVRFSTSPMFDSGMKQIEWGIDPDVKVDMDITDESNGYDTIIEKAISILDE